MYVYVQYSPEDLCAIACLTYGIVDNVLRPCRLTKYVIVAASEFVTNGIRNAVLRDVTVCECVWSDKWNEGEIELIVSSWNVLLQ